MTAASTRRGLLGAIAGVPAAVTFGTIAFPTAASSTGWRAALEAHRRAKAISDAYDRDMYEPAREAWLAREAAIPPAVVPYTDAAGTTHELRSDHDWSLTHARHVVAGRRKFESAEFTAVCREFMGVVAARDARIAACRVPFDPIYDESNRLDSITADACEVVYTYPVRTISELAEKALFAEKENIAGDEVVAASILADIKRIAAGGQ